MAHQERAHREEAPEGAPGGTPRGGARRAAKPKRTLRPSLVLMGLGALAALVAWGVLVWAAIDFGRSARGGDSGKWLLLGAASVAGVACLFGCLLLVTLLLRRVGILEDNRARSGTPPALAPVEQQAKGHPGRHGGPPHRH